MKEIVAKLYSLSGNKMPMILQTELAECGIASIAMIANYYGHETDLASLRRKFSTSLRGSNFQDLINIAAKLNLSARAVKLEPEGLKNLKLPCILHWQMNHFVVLRKINRNIAVIHDPAIGIVKYKSPKISQYFTGIAMELLPTKDFQGLSHRLCKFY